jgi:vancomycin permeability regulator SanA
VVLAGETDRRPEYALQLLRQGYARRVLINVPAGARIYDTTALQLAQKYIHDLPEAAHLGVCPVAGLSTREEAHDVEKCLVGEIGSQILIVTSDYHTRRALSIFQHEIRARSFSVAAVRDETQFGTRWRKHRQWAKTCLDEWLRMLWWSVLERWR